MYSMPDWNSLDSVRRAHSDLGAAALIFFALLVLFDVLAHLSKDEERKTLLEKVGLGFFAVAVLAEIIAYPYGQRNDTLSEQIIGSLDSKAKEAANNASSALTKAETADVKSGKAQEKADAVGKQADELLKKYDAAERELIELKAERMPRRLSSAQKAKLRQEVAAFAVKAIGVGCINTEREGFDFEQDFVDTFRSPDSPVRLDFWLTSCDSILEPAGPDSFHPPIEVSVGSARQSDAEILVKALAGIGIDKKQIKRKADTSPTLLRIMIGPHAQWLP
jgi:hypothetical protein